MEQEVTAADPSQGHPQMGGKLKGRSAFLLHPSPFHIPVVQAACISFLAYGFPTWPPSSPVVFKWADFASQGIFFFFNDQEDASDIQWIQVRDGDKILQCTAQPLIPNKKLSRPKCQ